MLSALLSVPVASPTAAETVAEPRAEATAPSDPLAPPPGEEITFYEGYYGKEKAVWRVDLDVDTDRDGTVENAADDPQEEVWTKRRGAVFLNNVDDDDDENDDDDRDKTDNRDQAIDGANDRADLAELVLRVTRRSTEDIVELRITGEDASKVRIFDETDTPRLGRVGGRVVSSYVVPNPALSYEITYLVEGLDFPGPGWKYLDLELSVDIRGLGVLIADRVRSRIAPYILLANTDRGEQVYYQDAGAWNRQFRTDLERVVPAPLRVPYSDLDYNDRWAQDEMEIGFTFSARSSMHVVLDTPRNRDLDPFPEEELLDPGVGHWVLDDVDDALADLEDLIREILDLLDLLGFVDVPDFRVNDHSGGNIEVSFRPVTAGGKRYLLGRALVGSTLEQKMKDFLSAQEVQAPILELNTDWLYVGHVDEVVSVIPGRSVLVPDTRLAWDALERADANGLGASVLFRNLLGQRGNRLDTRISDIVSNDPAVMLRMPSGELRNAVQFRADQRVVQLRLDQIRATLAAGLSLAPANIIRVPALFTNSSGAHAYLPAAVNGLVLNGKYACPEQFAPTLVPADGDFIEKLIQDAAGAGFGGAGNITFVDDFNAYNVDFGNVHCGTNVKRKLYTTPAWWEQVDP